MASTKQSPDATCDVANRLGQGDDVIDANGNGTVIGVIKALISVFATGNHPNATPVDNASGNKANAIATATLPAAVGKTTYVSGFAVTGSGATAGLPVTVTLVGLKGGDLSFTYTFAAGVLVANQPLIIEFPSPIPASAANTAIVLTCPASGAGGTNNTADIHGFQL